MHITIFIFLCLFINSTNTQYLLWGRQGTRIMDYYNSGLCCFMAYRLFHNMSVIRRVFILETMFAQFIILLKHLFCTQSPLHSGLSIWQLPLRSHICHLKSHPNKTISYSSNRQALSSMLGSVGTFI